MTPVIGKTVGITTPITVIGTWTSQTLINSLFNFPVGNYDWSWGTLSWDEEVGEDSYVRVDILKASDDSVLVSDISRKPGGVDLSVYSAIGTNNIKIKFKLYSKGNKCVVSNIKLKTKQSW
jgi:hypothetical protein